jgi:hypothetical protein
MPTYRISEAWEPIESIRQFFIDIRIKEYDRIIFFCLNEWEWDAVIRNATDAEVIDLNFMLQEKNVILDVIVTGKTNVPAYSNIQVHESNHWFIIAGFADFIWQYNTIADYCDLVKHKSQLKYPFVSLNHRSHPHRCMMMDFIAQKNLIDSGAITWHHTLYPGQEVDYPWQHFEPRVMQLSTNFNDCWLNPPDEYFNSFCQLISESTLASTIMSEKTLMAIYFMKPFLVQSAPRFYEGMDELGFLRYDEIFDYSFDLEEDDTIRTEMIVDNITRIANLSIEQLSELHKQLEPKIMHNFNNAVRLATDKNTWPALLLEVFALHDRGEYVPHKISYRFEHIDAYLQRANLP